MKDEFIAGMTSTEKKDYIIDKRKKVQLLQKAAIKLSMSQEFDDQAYIARFNNETVMAEFCEDMSKEYEAEYNRLINDFKH